MIRFTQVDFIRDKQMILKNINWHVKPKEHWAMLGLNGSGKSTILQMMSGYFWPSKGSLTVLDHHFGTSSIPELRQKIGVVSSALQQKFKGNEIVEQIVLSGRFASIGIYKKVTEKDLNEARAILKKYGGEQLIGKKYGILSQGQQQIVLISRALMADPQLLVLDEPCNGLDLFARERLLQTIDMISKHPDAPTLLYVTHHSEELIPCFNKLLLLKDGEIFKKGSTEDLMNEETLSTFYDQPIELLHLKDNRIAIYPL